MTSFTINNSDTTISCLKYLHMVYVYVHVCVHCAEYMQVHVDTRGQCQSVPSCIVFHLMPFNFYFSCVTLNAQHHDGLGR